MNEYNLFALYANPNLSSHQITFQTNTPKLSTVRFDDGRVYQIEIKYNRMTDMWVINVYLQVFNGQIVLIPQVLGIPLCFGLDLFANYKYLNIGEFYVFPVEYRKYDSPSYNTLVGQFIYIWRF